MDTPEEIAAKLALLPANPRVAELVSVDWPAPDGKIYYTGVFAADLLDDAPVTPIEYRLPAKTFQDIMRDSGIGDEEVSLDFYDGDDELSRLSHTHGEGQRVEILYWFPEVDLLLSYWCGHLSPPEQSGGDRFKASARSGFRSSQLPLPRRAFYAGCQAVFGGLLTTQAEIDEGDCPYSAHLAGTPGSGAFGTDNTWKFSATLEADWETTDFDDSGWSAAVEMGAYGMAPWGSSPAFPDASTPKWIWSYDAHATPGSYEVVYFRKRFTASHAGALLCVRCDDAFTAYVNGVQVGVGFSWLSMFSLNVTLNPGDSCVLAIAGANTNGAAGLAARLVYNVPGAGLGNLNPATGLPYTSCERTPPACIARLGDTKSYLGFDTVIESELVHETKGPNILVTSRGNETNLDQPLRVVAGQRHIRDLNLLAIQVQPDTRHPEGGSAKCLFAICEGQVKSLTNPVINGTTIAPMHLNLKLGERRQGATSFSPNVSNYSGTSLMLGVIQGDFTQAINSSTRKAAGSFSGEIDVEGSCDVRVYSSLTTYAEQYSQDRAWWLMHVLRNKRWGYGKDVAGMMVSDFIYLSAWSATYCAFTDKDGNTFTGPRTTFNAELIGRSTQQQIEDICRAGHYGLPFNDQNNLTRVVPLAKAQIFTSTPFVTHAFQGALVRDPTTIDLSVWVPELDAAKATSQAALNAAGAVLVKELFTSSEYAARSRDDEEYVNDLCVAYLNRGPESLLAVDFWVASVIADGRVAVADAFGASAEFIARLTDDDFVLFTDEGESRNIVRDGKGQTTLTLSIQHDGELTNRVVVTLDDADHNNDQVPLPFENVEQQLRAGRAYGDTSRRVVEKQFTAFGVTTIGEGSRLGNLLLDLGEFDEGGLQNNLRVEFTTWYRYTLTLHKYSIIKVKSAKLDRYGFDYFRIRTIRRAPDLKVVISAQAYPVDYYDQLDSIAIPPPIVTPGAGGGDGIPGKGPPFPIGPGDILPLADSIAFTLQLA